ncbi:MAG: hypothetical protein HS113_26055 [Verrucomicrobiales bacterium]|nr:hypothetical protein [Verrucomicrobiales bacterium]
MKTPRGWAFRWVQVGGGTVLFLRTERRPDWETAVAEHQRFLDSLDRHGH